MFLKINDHGFIYAVEVSYLIFGSSSLILKNPIFHDFQYESAFCICFTKLSRPTHPPALGTRGEFSRLVMRCVKWDG